MISLHVFWKSVVEARC